MLFDKKVITFFLEKFTIHIKHLIKRSGFLNEKKSYNTQYRIGKALSIHFKIYFISLKLRIIITIILYNSGNLIII